MSIGQTILSAKTVSTGLSLLLLALGAPHPALGESRETSASFGYQRLSVSDTDANGVFADVATSIAGPLALLGAVDWASHDSQAFGFDQSLTWLAASGGVRLRVGARRVVPFGQILFGAERDRLEIDSFGHDSSTHLLIQPGGGVAVRVLDRLNVVGQVDWRHVERDADQDVLRIVVGVRLRVH